MSIVGFEIENKPRKPLLIADTLLRVFHEAVLENDTGNSTYKHACLTKRVIQFQNQCGINLQKLQLSVTHHWKPPWLWFCTSQGITHVTNTSSSTWSVEVAIHGKLSEDNPTGFRGAVLFEILHKNAGSISGCTLKSLKKCIKRTIQSKKMQSEHRQDLETREMCWKLQWNKNLC